MEPTMAVDTGGEGLSAVRHSGPVLVDTSGSRGAALRPVPVTGIRLADGFWASWRTRAIDALLSQFEHLERSGAVSNLRRAATGAGEHVGPRFSDSDVYKWLEAACWALTSGHGSERLHGLVDDTVSLIADAQQDDGYLNSFFMFEHAAQRWQNMDNNHELYCAGHLVQAAIAHHRAGMGDRLLGVATRFADLICDTFGPETEGKRATTDGHPEIEMALVELYRETGITRYLDQARFFVDVRRGLGLMNRSPHPHLPFREYTAMAGHAVCHAYLNAGVTDLYTETGDGTLLTALQKQWTNAVTRQIYITGGLGARHDGEAFGKDYELPNERAYAETCAAVAWVMWNWRMLLATGEARYADPIETTLYNAVLSGFSLDGSAYFYVNPLADDGTHRRQEWYACACCPPNVARLLTSLSGYFYGTSPGTLWVHQYASGEVSANLPDGQEVRLGVRTRYPWDGRVEIVVHTGGDFGVRLRIPSWREETVAISIDSGAGDPAAVTAEPGGYAEIRRIWNPGDTLRFDLDPRPRFVASHPYVLENAGRVALTRGPLVYCLEATDNPGYDLRDLVVCPTRPVEAATEPTLPDGIVALRMSATPSPPDPTWAGALYRTYGPTISADSTCARATSPHGEITATAIPYYAWANRDPGQMQIWLRTS